MTTILPTVPGYAPGIVATEPLTLQCTDCGLMAVKRDEQGIAAFVILSGFGFHIHEDRAPRRCRVCLATVKAGCERCTAQTPTRRANR